MSFPLCAGSSERNTGFSSDACAGGLVWGLLRSKREWRERTESQSVPGGALEPGRQTRLRFMFKRQTETMSPRIDRWAQDRAQKTHRISGSSCRSELRGP